MYAFTTVDKDVLHFINFYISQRRAAWVVENRSLQIRIFFIQLNNETKVNKMSLYHNVMPDSILVICFNVGILRGVYRKQPQNQIFF